MPEKETLEQLLGFRLRSEAAARQDERGPIVARESSPTSG